MGKYGDIALQATMLVRNGAARSASEAWDAASRAVFPDHVAAQKKNCPRGAYLGLCEDRHVDGVPAGSYTRSVKNKRYAVNAARLLSREPDLARAGPTVLWSRVMRGEEKTANSQMDVVLTLFAHGLLRDSGAK